MRLLAKLPPVTSAKRIDNFETLSCCSHRTCQFRNKQNACLFNSVERYVIDWVSSGMRCPKCRCPGEGGTHP